MQTAAAVVRGRSSRWLSQASLVSSCQAAVDLMASWPYELPLVKSRHDWVDRHPASLASPAAALSSFLSTMNQ